MVSIKLCGFSEEASLKTAIQSNCDFLGFIFYEKSLRNISMTKAKELFALVPRHISKVAVVVDSDKEFLDEVANLGPDYIQFHGHESPEFIEDFQKAYPHIKTIKAFHIRSIHDLAKINDYDLVDLFLFDSKVHDEMGGSGQAFDWSVLSDIRIDKDWMLSGGINISNVNQALSTTKASMLDISSGIEEEKGVKSSQKIIDLLSLLKDEK